MHPMLNRFNHYLSKEFRCLLVGETSQGRGSVYDKRLESTLRINWQESTEHEFGEILNVTALPV